MTSMTPEQFLDQLAGSHPTSNIDKIKDLHTKKLWHELTAEVEDFLMSNTFTSGALVIFYENFVGTFATKLNRLRLAIIAKRVSEDHTDADASRAFVNGVLDVVKDSQDAVLLLQTQLAAIAMGEKNFKLAKEILGEVRTTVDGMPSADPRVHSALSRAAMTYHSAQGTPTQYYKNALLFLHHTPKTTLTPQECEVVAYELGIAACVGDDVYNFGELLCHPTIKSLEGGPHDWLYRLLVAFNTGSIPEYTEITTSNAAVLNTLPTMVANMATLQEKITICAFLELVFHRPANNRLLTFAEIALATKRPVEEVEFVLMRAMSLGLVRGVIDEVEQSVQIGWVKPRMLQTNQLNVVKERLGTWAITVDEQLKFMQANTADIVV